MNTVKRVHGGNHCKSCVFAGLTDDSDCPLMEGEDLEMYFDSFNQLKPIHFTMIKEAFNDCEINGNCGDDRSHFETMAGCQP